MLEKRTTKTSQKKKFTTNAKPNRLDAAREIDLKDQKKKIKKNKKEGHKKSRRIIDYRPKRESPITNEKRA